MSNNAISDKSSTADCAAHSSQVRDYLENEVNSFRLFSRIIHNYVQGAEVKT